MLNISRGVEPLLINLNNKVKMRFKIKKICATK